MSVLLACLSARRRLGGTSTCEHRDCATMPACFVVALYPRAAPLFSLRGRRGVFACLRVCCSGWVVFSRRLLAWR